MVDVLLIRKIILQASFYGLWHAVNETGFQPIKVLNTVAKIFLSQNVYVISQFLDYEW
jgi:hypothetical protein